MVRTFAHGDFDPDELRDRKAATGITTSLVLPARNEEKTVAAVIEAFLPLRGNLVDEIVVVDSLSTDGTAAVAADAGATVVALDAVAPEVPPVRGKGEAMWRALLATSGDLVVFCDADVLDPAPHYVVGLLGPLLLDAGIHLVKGFYRRPLVAADGKVTEYGGRVTELVARPLLSLYRPDLAKLVQPLAGEWGGRRELLESLRFPTGYGVEIAVLLDTHAALGSAGMAQVDLGTRTHSSQSWQALGVMAAEVMGSALRRLGIEPTGDVMRQYGLEDHGELSTPIGLVERPPVASLQRGSRRSDIGSS